MLISAEKSVIFLKNISLIAKTGKFKDSPCGTKYANNISQQEEHILTKFLKPRTIISRRKK